MLRKATKKVSEKGVQILKEIFEKIKLCQFNL
jgi:hypothetical protein